MSAVTTAPPAGWYEDDMVPGRERWWDGDRWTERVRRSEFGLDCWGSELARSLAGTLEQPSAHRAAGGRWSEPADADADVDAVAREFAPDHRGLADDERAPVDAWTAITDHVEIGPVVVAAVAIDDEPLAPPTERRAKQRSARARSERRTPKAAPPRRSPVPDDEPIEQVSGLALDNAPGGLADGGLADGWAPVAVEIAGDDWLDAEVRSTTPAAAEAVGAVAPSPLVHDADGIVVGPVAVADTADTAVDAGVVGMDGHQLADAAAVMAALAALSAPLELSPVRSGRSNDREGAPWRPDASGPVPVIAPKAEPAAVEPPPVSGASLIERHVEAEWAVEEREKRRRNRPVPPRPKMSSDSSTPGTSHTFAKIDREALDAAVALSSMVTPGNGVRAVPPGPRPPDKPAPTVPEAPVATQPAASPAPARPERVPRPARPAPPLPKWSDKPADGEDEGFVKIAARDRQKRVLGT